MVKSTTKRLAAAGSLATVLAAVIAGLTFLRDDTADTAPSSGDTSSGDQGSSDQSGGCVLNLREGNKARIEFNCPPASKDDESASGSPLEPTPSTPSSTESSFPVGDVDAWEELQDERFWTRGPDPTGGGPWPYVVGGTGGDGLYVRDGVELADSRLLGDPTLHDGKPVFAYCIERSGWEVVPGLGTEWLRVGYPQPSDNGETWIYAWWTAPLGHNGKIPDC